MNRALLDCHFTAAIDLTSAAWPNRLNIKTQYQGFPLILNIQYQGEPLIFFFLYCFFKYILSTGR